ncbi:MAG: LuxR C-terminal-related transcriptional regulator [Bacteroidia bacterium]|nr:LuxR C-terminal-related transcriptional regulator [Bacteroidia bacterium]
MRDKEYFSHLYEIASHLNQEYSLQAALRKALHKTVSLLNLETGWIWLIQKDNKSVYLAASYNLPPALSNYPERLSGWCSCIEKYLSNTVSEAENISEITCTRLKDIKSETRDLKFHATVPIFIQGEKAGILNLLSKESQKLSEEQLSMLNTISELIGIAIQRTRLQDLYSSHLPENNHSIREILGRVLTPRLDELSSNLLKFKSELPESERINASLELLEEIAEQIALIRQGLHKEQKKQEKAIQFQYPSSPLTSRELEVLQLVRKGHTNKQIAEHLYITERTIKFHLSSILSKLQAETRTEAVDTALRRGLLSL